MSQSDQRQELAAVQERIGKAVTNLAETAAELERLLDHEYRLRDSLGLLRQTKAHRPRGLAEILILEFIGRSRVPVPWSEVWRHTRNPDGKLSNIRVRLQESGFIILQDDGYLLTAAGRERLAQLCSGKSIVEDTPLMSVRRNEEHDDSPQAPRGNVGRKSYDVVIKTGDHEESGTTSKVCVQFIGDKGKCRFSFDDDVEPHFGRGSIDCACLKDAIGLGEPHTCCLHLEVQGHSPNWFVETVELVSVDVSTIWEFQQWIDSDVMVSAGRDRIV